MPITAGTAMEKELVNVAQDLEKLKGELRNARIKYDAFIRSRAYPKSLYAYRQAMAKATAELKIEGSAVSDRRVLSQGRAAECEEVMTQKEIEYKWHKDNIDTIKAEMFACQSQLKRFDEV